MRKNEEMRSGSAVTCDLLFFVGVCVEVDQMIVDNEHRVISHTLLIS